jgi:hypothetical protein
MESMAEHGMIRLYRDGYGGKLIEDLSRLVLVDKGLQGYKLHATTAADGSHVDLGTAFAIALPFAVEALADAPNDTGDAFWRGPTFKPWAFRSEQKPSVTQGKQLPSMRFIPNNNR